MDTTGAIQPVRLADSQIEKAGEVLARAFQDDPLCIYITPKDARRARTLPWSMAAFVRYSHQFGTAYATAEAVEGVLACAPPGHTNTTFMQMLRAGLPLAPVKVGLRDTLRFLGIVNHLERLHKEEAPPQHWYLMWLGVDPPSQGRGIGSALLRSVTSQADDQGLPCYLENTKAKNLALYQKHGFEVVSELDVPKGGPHIWTMRRDPRGRATC